MTGPDKLEHRVHQMVFAERFVDDGVESRRPRARNQVRRRISGDEYGGTVPAGLAKPRESLDPVQLIQPIVRDETGGCSRHRIRQQGRAGGVRPHVETSCVQQKLKRSANCGIILDKHYHGALRRRSGIAFSCHHHLAWTSFNGFDHASGGAGSRYVMVPMGSAAQARAERDAQGIGQAAHGQLRHQIRAMNLDRPRLDGEIEGDRLVGEPLGQPAQHITLPRRQARQQDLRILRPRAPLAGVVHPFERRLDCA